MSGKRRELRGDPHSALKWACTTSHAQHRSAAEEEALFTFPLTAASLVLSSCEIGSCPDLFWKDEAMQKRCTSTSSAARSRAPSHTVVQQSTSLRQQRSSSKCSSQASRPPAYLHNAPALIPRGSQVKMARITSQLKQVTKNSYTLKKLTKFSTPPPKVSSF